jgi:signal transduction histidine kinase
VRSLVHNLQGSIELESAEGEGALFRVHLPLWTG